MAELTPTAQSIDDIRTLLRSTRTGLTLDANDVACLLHAIDHVIDVLRDAQAEGGGYGFVCDLLAYLGATEEVPA